MLLFDGTGVQFHGSGVAQDGKCVEAAAFLAISLLRLPPPFGATIRPCDLQ